MIGKSLRKISVNVLCGLVYGEQRRRKLRVLLNAPLISYIKFIRRDIGGKIKKMHIVTGGRGANLIIIVNKKYVYKFPYRHKTYREMIKREERILSAFGRISPIYTPPCQILYLDDIPVRKYEFVDGKTLNQLPPDIVMPYVQEYGRAIGRFLYKIGCANPTKISDLKKFDAYGRATKGPLTPGFFRGWYQGDIYENFLIDPQTMDIIAIIDWEDACFMDFSRIFNVEKPGPLREVMTIARDEYIRLYKSEHKTKK